MATEIKSYTVCVLIPCYDNLPGLLTALRSIRYIPGELLVLVVDDGSPEPVRPEDLASCRFTDGPSPLPAWEAELIRLPRNAGITAALNAGLAWISREIRCEFIARLDCGDVCAPDRFYRQVDYLRRHPEVGLVGSWCRFHDPVSGTQYRYRTPTGHRAILRAMHLRNVFIHPTIVWRRRLLDQAASYPTDYPQAEDYAFCWNLLTITQGHIIDDDLLLCEINGAGLSAKFRCKQLDSRMKIVDTFASNRLLAYINRIKLTILMKIPYPVILSVKKMVKG